MLSKEMYELLKRIPRHPNTIDAEQILGNHELDLTNQLYNLLCEATHADYEYVNSTGSRLIYAKLSLTEKGQAVLEEYEAFDRNQKITKRSLAVAIIAMIASIASAFAAIASLIKMLI